MAQISKGTINYESWIKVWEGFISLPGKKGVLTKSDWNNLWRGFLTKTELVMIPKRLLVAVLVLSEWPEYTIADYLKMSPATVYKISEYIRRDRKYKNALVKLFPKKISIPKKKPSKPQHWILTLIEDLLAVNKDRSRLIYGRGY